MDVDVLAKLWLSSIILVQILIGESSESKCSNIDFENISPCSHGTVLTSSQGPCNALILSIDDAKTAPTVSLENAEVSLYLIKFVSLDWSEA